MFKGLEQFKYTVEDGIYKFSNPGKKWSYELADGRSIIVPDGFESEIPTGYRGLAKAVGEKGLPALAIYLYMCMYGAVQFYAVRRSFANKVLNDALKELKVGWYRRFQMKMAETSHSSGIWKRHKHPER